ncbi:MAG: recombinase RecA [Muribaculaceae bacterium]|nr:recombinase RecA [Muribaculaceae bacterium]
MAKKKTTAKKAVRISDTEEKKKALEMALAHLEKDFGTGTIMRLGDNGVQDIETVSTGSIGLDYALGVGGVPRGRITEIFGAESSGKTTLAIHIIAEAQKMGGVCAIIDAEHAFDRFYAEQLGVDVNNLWISQPDNGEQALEIAEQLINSGAIDVLVVDSVAALTPKAEIEGEMGDKNVGLQARLMSQAMRKLTGAISRTRTCCIFINQTREKIGNMYGPAQTTTGGNALKFYSTVRMEIAPSTMIKDSSDKPLGRVARVKVVKNKVAPPFKKAEFDIMFGEGISKAGEIIDYGVELGIIKKSGAWFSYGDAKIGQGKEGVRKALNDNPELMEELEEKVRQAIEEKLNGDKTKSIGNILASKETGKASAKDEDDDFGAIEADGDEDFFEEDIEIEE